MSARTRTISSVKKHNGRIGESYPPSS